jgi:hypothetical protein
MTATYTPEELSKLAGAVMVTSMAVSMVDVGIVSTAMEANAMAQELIGAAKHHPNNAVIQALFSEEAMKAKDNPAKLQIKPEEMKPEIAVDTAIAKINDALSVLAEKASSDDVQGYKAFLYACAERVANAAGSGLFGSGSQKVSDKEASALAKIKTTLGL